MANINWLSNYHKRLVVSLTFFVLTLVGMWLFWVFFDRTYYLNPRNNYSDMWRFVWMFPFVMLGLSIRAYRFRNDVGSPWVAYFKYCRALPLVCLVLFVMLHSFLSMGGWLFYPVSAIAIIIFSQSNSLIDKSEKFVLSFFNFKS